MWQGAKSTEKTPIKHVEQGKNVDSKKKGSNIKRDWVQSQYLSGTPVKKKKCKRERNEFNKPILE